MDLNDEPARHSSFFMDLNEEPPRHSSYTTTLPDLNEEPHSYYIHPLMNEIPVIFHPYVSHIQNVMGDGNCGFRAVAVCLGYGEDHWLYMRQQLLDELHSNYGAYATVFSGINDLQTSLSFFQTPAPRSHWMTIPSTGFLIANRFGVIVIFLSSQGGITIFPLWRGPKEFSYHRVIVVSLVNEHYWMVQLEGDFPMPTISAYWIRHRAPCAVRWEIEYMSRLELYREQMSPPNSTFVTLDDYE